MLRRVLQRDAGCQVRGFQQLHQSWATVRFLGGFRGAANHGEHGAFARIAYCPVGSLPGHIQGRGKIGSRAGLAPQKGISETLEELGKDDAAVASGTEEGALGQFLGDLAGRQAIVIRATLNAGAKGKGHIGSGIAVWDRKNIQGVDGVTVLFQPVKAGQKGPPQFGAGQPGILYRRQPTTSWDPDEAIVTAALYTRGDGDSVAMAVDLADFC